MHVAIAGAGSIAFATAALLAQQGHRATLWSPSGVRTRALAEGDELVARGAVEGRSRPTVAENAAALVESADAVLIAVPAYGHRPIFDAVAPHLRAEQQVVISSHASFGALYLSRLLARRGVAIPITAWGTTVVSGRQRSGTEVQVSTIRKQVDIATVPRPRNLEAVKLCRDLFGDRFVDRGSLMAIALSNLNPQNHMGIALGNMSRMERGETWSQGQNVTPNIGRLLERLDEERLAVASALGLEVRTIVQHFQLSFHVPVGSISDMNQAMHAAGRGGAGPATAESRYVLEDVPFGLAVTAFLGRLAGRPAILHEAGIDIFSAMYGRDFRSENDLLAALGLTAMPLERLQELCRDGYPHPV